MSASGRRSEGVDERDEAVHAIDQLPPGSVGEPAIANDAFEVPCDSPQHVRGTDVQVTIEFSLHDHELIRERGDLSVCKPPALAECGDAVGNLLHVGGGRTSHCPEHRKDLPEAIEPEHVSHYLTSIVECGRHHLRCAREIGQRHDAAGRVVEESFPAAPALAHDLPPLVHSVGLDGDEGTGLRAGERGDFVDATTASPSPPGAVASDVAEDAR